MKNPGYSASAWKADLSVEYVRASCRRTNPISIMVASVIPFLNVSSNTSSVQSELRDSISPCRSYVFTKAIAMMSVPWTKPFVTCCINELGFLVNGSSRLSPSTVRRTQAYIEERESPKATGLLRQIASSSAACTTYVPFLFIGPKAITEPSESSTLTVSLLRDW